MTQDESSEEPRKSKVIEESDIDSDDSEPKKKAKGDKGDIYKAPKTTAVAYNDEKQLKK